MENSDKALDRGAKRVYDVAPSEAFAEFMSTGWAPTPLTGIHQDEVVAPAFSKGKYTFVARFTVLKPKLLTTPSKEIVFTVK